MGLPYAIWKFEISLERVGIDLREDGFLTGGVIFVRLLVDRRLDNQALLIGDGLAEAPD